MLTGYKTLLFAIIVAVIGVIQAFDWGTIIPAQYMGITMTVIGIVVAVLRWFTNTPIGSNVNHVSAARFERE